MKKKQTNDPRREERKQEKKFNLKVNLAKTEKSYLPLICNDSRLQMTTDIVVSGNALFQHL